MVECIGWLTLVIGGVNPMATGTVSGTVVGPDGQAIVGAQVYLARYGNPAANRVITREGGRFRLGPIAATTDSAADLFVDAGGFARAYLQRPVVFPGSDHDLGEIRLDAGVRFRGQVVDTDGKPIAKAAVAVDLFRAYLGNTLTTIGPRYLVQTDENGWYLTPALPVCEMVIAISAPDRQRAYITRRVLPGIDELLDSVRLVPDVPIVGRVVDPDGQPIVGATIGGFADLELTTGSAGNFCIRGFGKTPPVSRLRVGKAGFATEWFSLKVPNQTVVLKRAAHIVGECIDAETGKAVHIDKAVLCNFQRTAAGEIIRGG